MHECQNLINDVIIKLIYAIATSSTPSDTLYWVVRGMAWRMNNLSQQEPEGHRVRPLPFLPQARA